MSSWRTALHSQLRVSHFHYIWKVIRQAGNATVSAPDVDRKINISIASGCNLASDRSDDGFRIPDNSGISDIFSLSLSLCLHASVVPCRFRRSSSFTAGNCGYSDDEVDQERDDGGFLPSFKLPVLSLPPTSLLVGLYRYYCSERGVITSDKILSNSLNIKIWHIKPCWIPLQFMLIFYHRLSPLSSSFPISQHIHYQV